ncbi:family 16 glycosylhydrolase [Changchengzhania lutea]|uniref:family 16 glycosylhydrolase n=1 Tax=Changchengzhania lutea TaxID=2049305 RepID=UPI00115E7489|nr:family 16 glycosylhydrolase [Changchengzhania lutea]
MKNFTKKGIKNCFNLILLAFGTLYSFAQCPNIVWADEFSGTSLDQTKWNYQIGDGCAEGICGWGNNELQSYQEGNVTVSNGTLKIKAQKERIKGSQYTSGRINSKAKGDFTYGRFEASIKLPAGDGLWPAFWMLSTNEPYGGWPQSGEIDIMEFVASDQNTILGYMHYGDPYPNNQSQGNTYSLTNGTFPEAFHEFAIEWEPGEIRWFMDGILYSTKRTEDVSPFNWPFDQDFHFLLNVAVGGNLGGAVNDSMLPATMEVDYVRVYDGFKSYISGNTVVLNQSKGETYAIGNLANNVSVSWSVPVGATIVSGQGSNTISVDFGNTSGTVSASFDDGCQTQALNLFVEVEPPFNRALSFENFDETPTASLALTTGTLTEVANPAANTINNSALSGKYDRNGGEQYDLVVYDVTNITDASQYVNKDKKFALDVYTTAPIGTDIILQLETADATSSNYPTGRHSRYIATIAENNNWQRLFFTLLNRPDGTAADTDVQTMVLLFNPNSLTSDTYYYDNFDSYDAGTGTVSNVAPTVSITSPTDGSSFDEGTSITVTADAADSDGSISQVEFFVNGSSIGVDFSQPYSMAYVVPSGTSSLTAVATDNESLGTTSQTIGITGQTLGDPTSVHVNSIVTGTLSAGKGANYGTATVHIVDDLGNNISSATVTGTFSGSFNEQATGTTDTNGIVVLQTQASAKGGVTVNLCVDNVSYALLPYDPTSNTVSCSSVAAKMVSKNKKAVDELNSELKFSIYPNPVNDVLNFRLDDFATKIKIYVYNSLGKTVLTKEFNDNKGEVNVAFLTRGIYFVKAEDELAQIKIMKIVKH